MGNAMGVPLPVFWIPLAAWLASLGIGMCKFSIACPRAAWIYGIDGENLTACVGNFNDRIQVPCLWTQDSGEPFIKVPSVEIYVNTYSTAQVSRIELDTVPNPRAHLNTNGNVGAGRRRLYGEMLQYPGLCRFSFQSALLLYRRYPACLVCPICSLSLLPLSNFLIRTATGSDIDRVMESLVLKKLPIVRSCPMELDKYCAVSGPDAACKTFQGFTVRCSRALIGSDLPKNVQPTNPMSLDRCLDLCKHTTSCAGVWYIADDNMCGLKENVFTGIPAQQGFIGE
jgi:hypothetical protein